jgi:D-alanyl-D-alanine carboxypeptidase/D-alanyl-D-alanine-endopeptidase (penicillin-binding protein 4)
MVNTPAQGRARLKPGTLRNAVALAGYVEDLQGRRWALAAFVNHDEAPQRGRAVLDAVVQWLVGQGAQGGQRSTAAR